MGAEFGYRGERLGLPQDGPGSIARPGRRLGALTIDWLLCVLIAKGLIAPDDSQAANLWTLAVFGLMTLLLVATLGTTPGKRLLRIKVVREDGSRALPGQVLIRTVLLLVVIPAAVWDRDTRSLHDKAAHTLEVRF
jgi:uncharacterized RDD family membrane protein YckC